MTDKGSKKGSGSPPEAGEQAEDADRPTVAPPFDVEAFARAATAKGPGRTKSSDSSLTAQREPLPAPPPPAGPGGERVTLTNEVELERARAKSAEHSEPPARPRHTPSALSIANARIPSIPEMAALRTVTPTSIEAAVLGAIATGPGPEITERTIDDPAAEMAERFSLGDYSGALEMAELILAEDPSNLEAAECGENCRSTLEGMYAAKLAPLDRTPVVVVPRTQLRWLSIDHRAGFILSLVDGSVTVDTIVDVSGMPRLDALRILHELLLQKIIAFKERGDRAGWRSRTEAAAGDALPGSPRRP